MKCCTTFSVLLKLHITNFSLALPQSIFKLHLLLFVSAPTKAEVAHWYTTSPQNVGW